jgi:AhpC/TSA family
MKLLLRFTLFLLLSVTAKAAASDMPRVLIYDDSTTQLRDPSPFTQSKDLWVTLAELTRATGFVLKPQGVCRRELCFPLPKRRRAEFLAPRGSVMWFNLSAFARLVKQPVAHDEKLATWYFGPRPETQNGYLANLEAPNFTLPDKSGKPHSLSDFRGKKVLLITWASW